jgi:type IV fimbrial biogenesis protein FimT
MKFHTHQHQNKIKLMNKNIKNISANGFTFIELMIVMTMVAVMAAIALPNLGQFIANNRLKSQMYDMLESINIARSEAVKRKVKTVMCRSADPTATTPACGGTANTWTTGWIVYAKGDANDAYNSATDTIIGIGNAADDTVNIMSNGSGNSYLVYKPDGSLNEAGTVVYAICDDRGESHGKQISIALVGRASITSNPITDCTP